MEKAVLPVELMLVVGAILAIIIVSVAIFSSMSYKPSTPTSQQKGDCAMRGGIKLENYDRLARDALDASTFVGVHYRSRTVSPCTVNENMTGVSDSCHIGEYDCILLEVTERACNLVDLNVTKPS